MIEPKTLTREEHMCALCVQRRTYGRLLRPADTDEAAIWVCEDCQHKLTRCVDDEGVKGG